jgi:hypothetical protein
MNTMLPGDKRDEIPLFFGHSSEFYVLLQVLASASWATTVEVGLDVVVAEHANLWWQQ